MKSASQASLKGRPGSALWLIHHELRLAWRGLAWGLPAAPPRIWRTSDITRALPVVGEVLDNVARPVWISEAMVDLYGWQTGMQVTLPLGGAQHRFTVAGVWRDYARQTGAIQMRLSDYRALSGDARLQWSAHTLYQGTEPLPLLAPRLPEQPPIPPGIHGHRSWAW